MFGWNPKLPTPSQRQVGEVLFNDNVHVLSSFELNRVASLTYGDDVCDEIYEMLEGIMRNAMDHSVLTVQKSLVITYHIIVYGSGKCVNSSIGLQRGVETLLEFNTVLWAQKLQGAAAMMYRLKGGGVDKGYPVREAAQKVFPLMLDLPKLRELRNSKADPNSLVPIGNDRVAFVSDDVRHFMLKKRIQEQYHLNTKSNLVKDAGGFGAGYESKDGKSVVGAAHGLEEMIKQAEIANRKFTDEGRSGEYNLPKMSDFSDYTAPNATTNNNRSNSNNNTQFGANLQQGTTAVADLLDFSAAVSQPHTGAAAEVDFFGGMGVGGTGDLLGTGAASDTITISLNAAPTPVGGGGLLDFGASPAGVAPAADISLDPFAHVGGLLDMGSPTPVLSGSDALGGVSNSMLSLDISSGTPKEEHQLTEAALTSTPAMTMAMMAPDAKQSVMGGGSMMGSSVMSSNSDRFAALDCMDMPAPMSGSSLLSAKEAENRLLGQSSFSSAPPPNPSMSMGDMTIPTFAMPGGSVTTENAASEFASLPGAGDGADLMAGGSGLKVAQTMSTAPMSSSWEGAAVAGGHDDDGFMMGGTMGAGLEPQAPAPCAPPPPPPM